MAGGNSCAQQYICLCWTKQFPICVGENYFQIYEKNCTKQIAYRECIGLHHSGQSFAYIYYTNCFNII